VYKSYIHVLAAAFLMGLVAAAPIGPVNMMAIRRGVAGGWRHTLACGVGSISGDLVLFSLALAGGNYFLPRLSNPKVRVALWAFGAALLIPAGISFLVLAVNDPRHAYHSARRRWREGPVSQLLIGEAAKCAALTLLNPLTILYWIAVASTWLPFAYPVLGPGAAGWGVLMVSTGLMAWFTALVLFVDYVPQHASAILFRAANATLGLILVGFGMYCAVVLFRHLLAGVR
jgi:threonine/homoserine/homoserine lactone efflux protein